MPPLYTMPGTCSLSPTKYRRSQLLSLFPSLRRASTTSRWHRNSAMTTTSSGGCTKRRPNGGGSPEPPRLRPLVRITINREALAVLDKQALAAQLGIGLVSGWLASWIVGGSGLLRYVLTGVVGSFVGAFLLDRLGIELGIRNPLTSRIVTATIGAVLVILAARLVA